MFQMIYITKGLLSAGDKQSSQASNSKEEKAPGLFEGYIFFLK